MLDSYYFVHYLHDFFVTVEWVNRHNLPAWLDLLTRDHVTAPAADDMAEIASVVAAVTVAP